MTSHWYSKMGPLDAYHFGDSNSFFVYKAHEKYIPIFPSYYPITAIEGSAFTPSTSGGEVWSFIPPQSGRRISDFVIHMTLPALAPVGVTPETRANGDVVCWENDAMRCLWERIEMVDGPDVVETVYPDYEHWEKQVKKRSETKDDRSLTGWYDTTDDLNDAAMGTQDLWWTIPFHFSGSSLDRALRIDELVNHDLRFRFFWRPWADIVFNGSLPALHGGNQVSLIPSTANRGLPATITDIKIYATYFPLAGPEKVFYRKNAIFRTLSLQRKAPFRIDQAVTEHHIPLMNFSYPIVGFLFRIKNPMEPDSPNSLWSNMDVVTHMGLTVDGQKRYELLPIKFWTDVLHSKMWPSLPEEVGWYFLPITTSPMLLPDVVSSSLNITQCNEVTLDLLLSRGVTADVQIYALTPNFFQYLITGDKCVLKTFFK